VLGPLGAQIGLFLIQYAWMRITIGRTIRARELQAA